MRGLSSLSADGEYGLLLGRDVDDHVARHGRPLRGIAECEDLANHLGRWRDEHQRRDGLQLTGIAPSGTLIIE